MSSFGLSEGQVLDTFNSGKSEKWKSFKVSVKKYSGYEIKVFWKRSPNGKYIIISVNKRRRR
jgi:hypothetical protein